MIFSPGQTSLNFTIPVLHDFAITGPLTVGIALSNPTAGFLGTPSAAILTINDVDQSGSFAFGSSTFSVSAGATVANVTVLRVGGAGGTASVTYATSAGTAVAGTDYTTESGVLTFNPGQTSQTIAIPILRSNAGSNKTFSVGLSSPGRRRDVGVPRHTDDHDRAPDPSGPTARRDQHQRLGPGVAPPGDPRRRQ